jgi:hypothetical protein
MAGAHPRSGQVRPRLGEPLFAVADHLRVRDGAWLPILEGNATIVYEAEAGLDGRQAAPVEYAAGENAAYATLDAENTAHLKSAGVTTAHP